MGSLSLLQGIFPTQGSNPGLPHCRQILYHLSHKGGPGILEWVAFPFSRGSSRPRNWTQVSCIAGRFLTSWATGEAHSSKYHGALVPRTPSCNPFLLATWDSASNPFCFSYKWCPLPPPTHSKRISSFKTVRLTAVLPHYIWHITDTQQTFAPWQPASGNCLLSNVNRVGFLRRKMKW